MHYVQPAQVEVSEVRLQLYKTGAFLNQWPQPRINYATRWRDSSRI
jgi:hypothetical protein